MPAAPAATQSATLPDRDLAQRVDEFLVRAADSGFNGSVLIARSAHIVLHKAYGWADRQHRLRVTTATPFWIASISKQFAAAAILKLAEQRRLSVSDSISRFFGAVPEDKRGITIHHLLTHTAGLQQQYAADGIADRDAAVRAILAVPSATVPGGGFNYSNDAYNLIAAIVEIASGRPYEDYVREQLLEPAGLKQTGFWGPAEHPEVAAILGAAPGVGSPNWGYRGAVGMYSTPGDLYHWCRALEGHQVLSEKDVRKLLTPNVTRGSTGVAYGWFVSQTARDTRSVWTRGYEGFGHGGVLATYPEEQVTIIIVTNSGETVGNVPVSHKLAEDLEALVFSK
ncbi:MAG TPA: serine hydrolase domain-containing protein [Gemmatimonadales bacterium]